MKRRINKELLIVLAAAVPVLVQYAIMDSDESGVLQFFAEVAGIYAAVGIVRGVRWGVGRPGRQSGNRTAGLPEHWTAGPQDYRTTNYGPWDSLMSDAGALEDEPFVERGLRAKWSWRAGGRRTGPPEL